MPKISQLLQQGRDLITNPEHWTQGAYARDKFGSSRTGKATDAVCFCSLGAIYRVVPPDENTNDAGYYLRLVMDNIMTFNDNHSHEEVLMAWDLAIELAKTDEKKERSYAKD